MAEYAPHHLTPIVPEEVPQVVANHVYERSHYYEDRKALIHAFRNIMRFDNGDGIITYIAENEDDMSEHGSGLMVSTMHAVDLSGAGDIVGYGQVSKAHESIESDDTSVEPFVAITETREDLRGQGLGKRRLHVMNAATVHIHGEPLHSDADSEEEAIEVWQSLERAGRVERYRDEYGDDRFKFKQ